ncbi:hypothetical protein AN640_06905 [Candidatus Epulonipiscium fishelsonii]|uniref:Uncharacterized protein n=1 Tax=Candidatus Epulonipiscium fishelsonii TaxID=77094 RepID=A0ACC8XHA0_9FIRM|nr:hypothetical protein AN640_06905 [Epulopiscium sp. SCG-D08WGA-EpuloA1]OON95269.1 MAG: hypothetical protein ATN32_07200 [Epulopiscium sp. AS2M-Bin002]
MKKTKFIPLIAFGLLFNINVQAIEYYHDESFSEKVVGFDINNFINSPFSMNSLEKYKFRPANESFITRNGVGYMTVIDNLDTELQINFSGIDNYGNLIVESVEVYVPSYEADYNEVQAICDPYNYGPLFYDSGAYYYNCIRDGLEIRYTYLPSYSPNSNPDIFYLSMHSTPKYDYTSDYDTNYILPNSDINYLSWKDISGLSAEQARLARNEIYARYGYIFNSDDLNQYFSNQSWYYPYVEGDTFSNSNLNKYEQANVSLLKQYEATK